MEDKKTEKICPLMSVKERGRWYCEEAKCGWWNENKEQCSIVTIAEKGW